MSRNTIFLRSLVILSLMLAAAVPLAAQVNPVAGVTVNATNGGAFSFTITTGAVYNFGTISSGNTSNSGGTENLTNGVAGTNDMTFTSGAAAILWTVNSAPARPVRIVNTSSATPANWGTVDNLKLSISDITKGNITACTTPITYGTNSNPGSNTCSGGVLGHSAALTVGNGNNGAAGSLRLAVTVADIDPLTTATWVVQLTAYGS